MLDLMRKEEKKLRSDINESGKNIKLKRTKKEQEPNNKIRQQIIRKIKPKGKKKKTDYRKQNQGKREREREIIHYSLFISNYNFFFHKLSIL